MTTFKATVKKPRNDGFYTVYIRLTHLRKSSYIKTNKIVDAEHIEKDGDLTDPVVNEYCAMLIRQYTDRLNRVDATRWSVKEVVELKMMRMCVLAIMPGFSLRKWKRTGMNVMQRIIILQLGTWSVMLELPI